MAFNGPTGPAPHSLDVMATRLFQMAIKEGWPGVLLNHLFEGCGVTIDGATGRPLFISPEEIAQLSR